MLCAIQAGNITEIRYYNFQPQWALLYSGSLPNFNQAYDLIEMGFMMVKFGMLSCYSRCCVVLYTLISGIRKIMFSCQTSPSTLIHSRSASLIKLRPHANSHIHEWSSRITFLRIFLFLSIRYIAGKTLKMPQTMLYLFDIVKPKL